MRIIAGRYRGRAIKAPLGDGTRPTTDRVREAMFSSITSLIGSLEDKSVLDAFAGSGALGIEALSRGASYTTFIDSSKGAVGVLQRNLNGLSIPSHSYSVYKRDVLEQGLPKTHNRPFDVIFLDPPYATSYEQIASLLNNSFSSGIFDPCALCVYEHATGSNDDLADALEACSLQIAKHKDYGKTSIDYIVFNAL